MQCAIAATKNAAIHEYQWSEGLDLWVRIDLDHAIGSTSTGGWIRSINKQTLIGCATYRGGWGHDHYSIYFRIEFDQDVSSIASQSTNHQATL